VFIYLLTKTDMNQCFFFLKKSFFENYEQCSYVKSYSSSSLLFVKQLLFCELLAFKTISSKIIFFHFFYFIHFYVFLYLWLQIIPFIHSIHLKWKNYIQTLFVLFRYHLLHLHKHISMKDVDFKIKFWLIERFQWKH
jgi:hypothetical protein